MSWIPVGLIAGIALYQIVWILVKKDTVKRMNAGLALVIFLILSITAVFVVDKILTKQNYIDLEFNRSVMELARDSVMDFAKQGKGYPANMATFYFMGRSTGLKGAYEYIPAEVYYRAPVMGKDASVIIWTQRPIPLTHPLRPWMQRTVRYVTWNDGSIEEVSEEEFQKLSALHNLTPQPTLPVQVDLPRQQKPDTGDAEDGEDMEKEDIEEQDIAVEDLPEHGEEVSDPDDAVEE